MNTQGTQIIINYELYKMKILRQLLEILTLTAIISFIGYYTVPQFEVAIDQKIEWLIPCQSPITYSIGEFDERFGITKEFFLSTIQTGEKVWEDESKKDLFKHVEEGGKISINLIYDNRQASTDKLKKLGYIISDDKASYENLKSRYDNLRKVFDQNKVAIDNDIVVLKQQQRDFEKEIAYWNDNGGAPTKEYNRLNALKEALNKKAASINQRQEALNQSVDTINSLATVLNELINTLNLDVEKYNDNQDSIGEEFDQGEYVIDSNGRRIDIYQFDNKDKLTRVLAHELGHAIGLPHNDNPVSLMYALNQNTNLNLSMEDAAALKDACNIK